MWLDPNLYQRVALTSDGSWAASSSSNRFEVEQDDNGSTRVVIGGDQHVKVLLTYDGIGTPRTSDLPDIRLESPRRLQHLEIGIDPTQNHAELGVLSIDGEVAQLSIFSPIWVGDPTELGTGEVHHLCVGPSTERLELGGDELYLGRLDFQAQEPSGARRPPRERDDGYDRLRILDDSRVFIEASKGTELLSLGANSYVQFDSPTGIYLGSVGSDAELCGDGVSSSIEDWKVHLCGHETRLKLSGVLPFDYSLMRKVARHISVTGPNVMASYTPIRADSLPIDLTRTPVVESEWVTNHVHLVEQYSMDPAVQADARWLAYEHRRGLSEPRTLTWYVLGLLRCLGYGLKVKPALATWVCIAVIVATSFAVSSGLTVDPLGGWASWERAGLLGLETVLLPTGVLPLTDGPENSVLLLHGTSLRVARLASSVAFAAVLLAVRARVRLPRLFDAKLC